MLAVPVTSRAIAAAVAALVACAACGGATEREVPDTSASPDGGYDGAVTDAGLDGFLETDAPADDGCATVGTGVGLESCCHGKLCRGECSPAGDCVCYGSGAVGGCPPGAACCKSSGFKPHTPTCNAPQDCALD